MTCDDNDTLLLTTAVILLAVMTPLSVYTALKVTETWRKE